MHVHFLSNMEAQMNNTIIIIKIIIIHIYIYILNLLNNTYVHLIIEGRIWSTPVQRHDELPVILFVQVGGLWTAHVTYSKVWQAHLSFTS